MTKQSSATENQILKQELMGLFEHIQKIRREIASIRKPGVADDRFDQMSDELDAIVGHTETATNTIMENVEAISDLVIEVRKISENESVTEILNKIENHAGEVFTACSFQDITGQRITKVVRSLAFVEERVNTLIGMWGKDALSAEIAEEIPVDADEALLNGPQLDGQGVSQEDVDRMLNGGGMDMGQPIASSQDDIDKMFE